jgi:flagellar biosynthesis anti-sigma factor FlgM
MINSIGKRLFDLAARSADQKAPAVAPQIAPPAGRKQPSPALQLSDSARSHSSLTTAASFDAKRVDQIKAALARGTYTVDPEKIATHMIAFESGWQSLGQK